MLISFYECDYDNSPSKFVVELFIWWIRFCERGICDSLNENTYHHQLKQNLLSIFSHGMFQMRLFGKRDTLKKCLMIVINSNKDLFSLFSNWLEEVRSYSFCSVSLKVIWEWWKVNWLSILMREEPCFAKRKIFLDIHFATFKFFGGWKITYAWICSIEQSKLENQKSNKIEETDLWIFSKITHNKLDGRSWNFSDFHWKWSEMRKILECLDSRLHCLHCNFL